MWFQVLQILFTTEEVMVCFHWIVAFIQMLVVIFTCVVVFLQTWTDPLSSVLFQSLLDEPNPNSPANNLAAKLYQENRREYEKKVKVVVEESWVYCGEVPSEADWPLQGNVQN